MSPRLPPWSDRPRATENHYWAQRRPINPVSINSATAFLHSPAPEPWPRPRPASPTVQPPSRDRDLRSFSTFPTTHRPHRDRNPAQRLPQPGPRAVTETSAASLRFPQPTARTATETPPSVSRSPAPEPWRRPPQRLYISHNPPPAPRPKPRPASPTIPTQDGGSAQQNATDVRPGKPLHIHWTVSQAAPWEITVRATDLATESDTGTNFISDARSTHLIRVQIDLYIWITQDYWVRESYIAQIVQYTITYQMISL